MERWAVHLTLESSTKQRVKERARADRRSVSSFLSRIVEEEVTEPKEDVDERPAR